MTELPKGLGLKDLKLIETLKAWVSFQTIKFLF